MKVAKSKNLKDIVFIDIETASIEKELTEKSPYWDSWAYKNRGVEATELPALYKQMAALSPEFAKVVVISVGRITPQGFKVVSYNNPDEKVLLEEFNRDLGKVQSARANTVLCGHAAIGFDIPFIHKRSMINRVECGSLIDTVGLKPWEVTAIDTKVLWQGTSYRPTSLINIAVAMGIPSPKDDISGADVGRVYWEDNDLASITRYCEKDVVATAKVFMGFRGEDLPETLDMDESLITYLVEGGKYTESVQDDLVNYLVKVDEDDRDAFYDILGAVVSGAKGSKTDLKKSHITALKKRVIKELK